MSPDGRMVFAGTAAGELKAFDGVGRQFWSQRLTEGIFAKPIWGLSTSWDGSFVVANVGGKTLLGVDRSGRVLWRFESPGSGRFWSATASESGNLVVSGAGSGDKNLYVFDPRGLLRWQQEFGGGTFSSLISAAVSSDGSRILAGSYEGELALFDWYGSRIWATRVTGSVRALACSNDLSVLAIASRDESGVFPVDRVTVFDMLEPRQWELKWGTPVTATRVARDGSLVIVHWERHTGRFRMVPAEGNVAHEGLEGYDRGGRLLWTFPTGGSSLVANLSSDGSIVALASAPTGLCVLGGGGNEISDRIGVGNPLSLEMSADGSLVAVGSLEGHLTLVKRR